MSKDSVEILSPVSGSGVTVPGVTAIGEGPSTLTSSIGVAVTSCINSEEGQVLANVGPLHPQAEELWSCVREELRRSTDSQVFHAYIEPLRLLRLDQQKSEAVIAAPTRFHRTHVENHFRARIVEIVKKSKLLQESTDLQLVFTVESLPEMEPGVASNNFPQTNTGVSNNRVPYVVVKRPLSSASAPSISGNDTRSGLNPRYTFENFVVGDSNQFCHAAALQVAEKPGLSYNPLFIYGGVGLGKTHLLHAIGNCVLQRNPRARVMYSSSETFTNDLIQALRNGKMDEFKGRIRNIDLLLVDDIQFMSGKERTQEEFFHTFNALYHAKNQSVITSDKLPQEITGLEERLQTRFAWGLIADIQAPDLETRIAILRRRALQEGLSLPQDVAAFVAEHVSSNVRELEGALTKLQATSSLRKLPITLQLAQSALGNIIKPKKINITVDLIKKAVAVHFNLKVSDLCSKRRSKNLSFPRHIAMYLCRKHTTSSYPEIGTEFGGRDHSSVIHAASVVSGKISTDRSLKVLVEELEKRLFE